MGAWRRCGESPARTYPSPAEPFRRRPPTNNSSPVGEGHLGVTAGAGIARDQLDPLGEAGGAEGPLPAAHPGSASRDVT